MKKLISVMLCCLFLCLCSCSNEKTSSQLEDTERGQEFEPLTEIQDGRKNIYLIVKSLGNSYWDVVLEGAKAAGEDFDCNVYYGGTYSETDWEYQADLLDTCVKQNADAVLLSPDDSVRLAPKISEIYEKDIPMILIDTIANTDSYNLCYMTDNLIAGRNAAKEMIALLEKRDFEKDDAVNIGIMVGSVASQTINERLAGFFQFWTQNAPESWHIIPDIVSYDGNNGLIEDLANGMLEKHPEINGVYGTNNGPTAGFAKVLKEQGRTDICIVGFDYSNEIAELIASPDYSAATMLQKQFNMSYDGIQSALSLTEGEENKVKFVDTGVVTVTYETLSTPEVQEVILHN